jgi:hypothetical protein
MTDGTSAMTDHSAVDTWAEITARIASKGCAEVLAEVEIAESDEPIGLKTQRSKKHDDKTAVLIR